MIPAVLENWLGIRLFGYITFRAVACGMTAFLLALWWGQLTIRWLKANKVTEDLTKTDLVPLTREPGALSKRDTPTMGGSFLVAALIASVVLWGRLDNVHVILAIVLTAGMAAVGFVDDFKKLTIPGSHGMSSTSKMIGLSVVVLGTLGALVYYSSSAGRDTLLNIYPPFFNKLVIPLGTWGVLGAVIFVAFQWLVVVGTANAANFTDGLDGLAAGCMIISGVALGVFCYVSGRFDWTGYLNLPHVAAASEMAVVAAGLCGACMGFLWYNAYPAKVFMGDSGSLPIGGLLAWLALVSKQELVLPLIGCVFFISLGSSWLQTFYYRRSGGQRVFTCAPLHHGLERHGGVFVAGAAPWHEVTVVVRFWIIAAVGAMASLALLKVR
ncbi:MAG: phospho-N-acetylmuramoyl-pentapeptide-transferase [bacterium]|nr:phospho-N-acetylmuramoyl-pentapeptide-transferase [Planctomycetota bacterium]HIL52055.1 phospho-N-acetylmuramoyl-pentapeptide-transferase [Planctomycetota bacterium]